MPHLPVNFLILITDERWCSFRRMLLILPHLGRAGVDIIQYRDKDVSDRVYHQRLLELKKKRRGKKPLLMANDRLGAAIAADVDGIHLGQTDLPADAARKIIGTKKIIGLSVHSQKEAHKSFDLPVNYIAAGPVFPTQTKVRPEPRLSRRFLRWLPQNSPRPLVAVGGIDLHHLSDACLDGFHGLACSRSLLSHHNIPGYIQKFRRCWNMS